MDDVLCKLGSFVSSGDSRLACAAAVILAELAPRQPEVVAQLIKGLDHPDPVRRQFIIEALGRIGTPESAAALVPLIKAGGQPSELALRAIAHTAGAALKSLLQLIGTVPPALLERIAECVGRTGEPLAFSSLLEQLRGADVDICKAVRVGLRSAMPVFNEKSKENLRKQLEKYFQDKSLVSQPTVLIALLKISGDLGHVGLQKFIFDRIEAKEPVNVRQAALQAVARLHLSSEERAKLAGRLLPLMLETEQPRIAEFALEATRSASLAVLSAEHFVMLRKLMNSPSSRVREFSMNALAARSSTRTHHELMACLDNPDRMIREEALTALSHSATAAVPLAERLLETKSAESIHELSRALLPQASHLSPKLLERLAEAYVALCAAERLKEVDAQRAAEERRKVLLAVLRAANSHVLTNVVLAGAEKLRKKEEHRKAFELLRSVIGISGWSDSHRIEMALAGLNFSPKDLGRNARNADFNLQTLQEVFFGGRMPVKDVLKVVLKDASLNRRTHYYLGFHFVERMQTERAFGQLLLEQLAESRAEEGKLAREKLIIEGLLQVKNGQNGKMGILEERAKVLRSAEEMAVAERINDERKAAKAAQSKKAGSSVPPKKSAPPAKSAPSKKAAPPKKVTQAAPPKKAAPLKKSKLIEKAPLKKTVAKSVVNKMLKQKSRK